MIMPQLASVFVFGVHICELISCNFWQGLTNSYIFFPHTQEPCQNSYQEYHKNTRFLSKFSRILALRRNSSRKFEKHEHNKNKTTNLNKKFDTRLFSDFFLQRKHEPETFSTFLNTSLAKMYVVTGVFPVRNYYAGKIRKQKTYCCRNFLKKQSAFTVRRLI